MLLVAFQGRGAPQGLSRIAPKNAQVAKPRSDYDSPWKDALERHFRSFLEFFFPDIADDIDWAQGYQLLDKELRRVTRDAELGHRDADILVRLTRNSGSVEWLLIHVEVQSQKDPEFPRRMYVYHHRIYDKYGRDVVSLAILGDEDPEWRPDQYHRGLWGCSNRFVFPMRKLLDFPMEVTKPQNPFSWLVVAHRTNQITRDDPQARYEAKRNLLLGLYQCGLTRKEILEFFGLVDWILALPATMEYALWKELTRFEKEKKMPYITSVERIGRKRGHKEGVKEGHKEGHKEGVKEGELNAKRALARRLLGTGSTVELVADVCDLPRAEVESIKEKVSSD